MIRNFNWTDCIETKKVNTLSLYRLERWNVFANTQSHPGEKQPYISTYNAYSSRHHRS